MEKNSENIESGQYLTFQIGEERYAVGILRVKEILRYEEITRVPRSPRFIRGVINLRGYVVPVVDLAVKFGGRPAPTTLWTCIVIIEANHDGDTVTLGLVCDAVDRVTEMADADIQQVPRIGTRHDLEYLKGMGKIDQQFVLILDTDKVFSLREMEAAAIAAKAAEGTDEEAVERPQEETATAGAGA